MKPDSAPPHLFVVFGATGDLARRKLLPAIARLAGLGAIDGQKVLGVARSTEYDDASFRKWAREVLEESDLPREDLAAWCDECLFYQPMDGHNAEYQALARRIAELEQQHTLPGNRLFYLAVPPPVFPSVVEGLGRSGLNASSGFTRLVFEKPFGEDLASGRELNALVHRWFREEQVYRIDHYLGKETVQNLIVFRFANPVFESLWSRDRIENVQITVAESLGVGTRAGYYDRSGAVRDMLQNHLTQILTLIAMEVPVAYDADSVRNEKIKVLRSVRPIDSSDVVLGQYARGQLRGENVPGYREERDVPAASRTATYVALRLDIDNWRWKGIPFYLRTGKRMAETRTQIAITFKSPPVSLFKSMQLEDLDQNVLWITLQPDEGFSLSIGVKRPGEPLVLEPAPLTFRYGEAFGDLPDAYVTLLHDVLIGDQTLFVHADEVEQAWELYEPLLGGRMRLHEYAAGSWGPPQADQLLARSSHVWRRHGP